MLVAPHTHRVVLYALLTLGVEMGRASHQMSHRWDSVSPDVTQEIVQEVQECYYF